MSERAAPLFCPYCGDEDLRPDEGGEPSAPRWLCVSCRRVFSVTFAGLRLPERK
jgi:transposase-like protein